MRNNDPAAIRRARRLRRNMSESERKLWAELRRRNTTFRFRKQYPSGPYVLDFYCPEALLCVEVDGDQHSQRLAKDARRDAWLAERSVLTLRISTAELYDNLDGVVECIYRICCERTGREP